MSNIRVNVFISHSWMYSNHYDSLSSWIFGISWDVNGVPLQFCDYSVPQYNPIHNTTTDKALKEAIYQKLALSHVIVIPTGMYANYSKWIKKEIDGAIEYKKPILAVNPWGQERTSCLVTSNSDRCVGWSSKSVVNGIWELYNKGRKL